MQHYFGVAKEEGITNEELGAVQSIVMAVAAGKVRAQFRESRIKSKNRSQRKQQGPVLNLDGDHNKRL